MAAWSLSGIMVIIYLTIYSYSSNMSLCLVATSVNALDYSLV